MKELTTKPDRLKPSEINNSNIFKTSCTLHCMRLNEKVRWRRACFT